MFMNEYDVAYALERASAPTTNDRPNLLKGAAILARLVEWTNQNSDGWPYWAKPSRAANSLQQEVHARTIGRAWYENQDDIDPEVLKRVLRPVKAFLTRHNVAPDVKAKILGEAA